MIGTHCWVCMCVHMCIRASVYLRVSLYVCPQTLILSPTFDLSKVQCLYLACTLLRSRTFRRHQCWPGCDIDLNLLDQITSTGWVRGHYMLHKYILKNFYIKRKKKSQGVVIPLLSFSSICRRGNMKYLSFPHYRLETYYFYCFVLFYFKLET